MQKHILNTFIDAISPVRVIYMMKFFRLCEGVLNSVFKRLVM
jgi:hypothetical protein